ncbi:MAG: dATP/dGTP diphosphohydrolase domain-containing protein [Methanomassiliicoccales archaeon]|jgi:hypothetical protein
MTKKPDYDHFKDSGARSQFNTGAVRDAQGGKGRMDLLPFRAIFEVAKVLEGGAKKYDSRNWEKGIPLSRYADSGLRHMGKYLRGDRDEPHDAMACWNFLCLIETRMRIEEGLLPAELNDLPWNPLELLDNPLNIEPTDPNSELVKPERRKSYKKTLGGSQHESVKQRRNSKIKKTNRRLSR